MQITIVLLAALVAFVASENCHPATTSTNQTCMVTACSVGTVECIDIMGTHLCTCMQTSGHTKPTCSVKADCNSQTTFTATCTDLDDRHCVDSACRCIGSGHNHGNHGHGNGQG